MGAGQASTGQAPSLSTAQDVVQVAATQILQVAGLAAYHTSIILGEKEYYFDSDGIASAPALWSHFAGIPYDLDQNGTEVFVIGKSALSGTALCAGLDTFFRRGSYDILLKNCNSFTDAACYFLTRERLPGKYNRLERLLAGTRPVSTKLLTAVMRGAIAGFGDPSGLPQDYIPNPEAVDFSVEDIVADCNRLDAACGKAALALPIPAGKRYGDSSTGGTLHTGRAEAVVCDPLSCLLPPTNGGNVGRLQQSRTSLTGGGIMEGGCGLPTTGDDVTGVVDSPLESPSIIFEAEPVFCPTSSFGQSAQQPGRAIWVPHPLGGGDTTSSSCNNWCSDQNHVRKSRSTSSCCSEVLRNNTSNSRSQVSSSVSNQKSGFSYQSRDSSNGGEGNYHSLSSDNAEHQACQSDTTYVYRATPDSLGINWQSRDPVPPPPPPPPAPSPPAASKLAWKEEILQSDIDGSNRRRIIFL